MNTIDILYKDDHYIAVDKPAGLLMHRTGISRDTVFLLQTLRDQIGRFIYPVHRLDRPTSGVVIFGLSSEAAQKLCDEFSTRKVCKTYLAVVRGYTPASGVIDHEIKTENKDPKSAVTYYRTLQTAELNIPVSPYATSRYSLVEAVPKTGRMHQLRKHFKHIAHPIIGDTTYGRSEHNRMFRERFNIFRLLLFAYKLKFIHPYTGAEIHINASIDKESQHLFKHFGWDHDTF